MKQKLLITLCFSLFWGLVACQPTGEPAAPAAQATESAPAPQLAGGVLAEGEVVPVAYANLSFQTSGRVAELLVEKGQMVAAGDPLLKLEAVDLEIALSQAQAQLASAEAGLASAQTQLPLAEAGVQTAQLRVEIANAQLTLIQAGPLPEEIAAAEAQVAAAEARILQATGSRDAALNIGTNSQVKAAEAQVIAANAQVTALEDGYQTILDTCFETPNGEVCPLYGPVEEQTRAQLNAARAQASAAQAALDQLNAGATPAQQRAAGGAVAIAIANRDLAQAQLDLLLAGATPEQIKQAEVAVEQAQSGVTIAESGLVQAQAAIEQAEAAVATAEAQVTSAELALAKTILTAPTAGTVADVMPQVGELVNVGQPVLVLADFSQWVVETTDLTELDVAKVAEGSEVTVSFDAIPGVEITGEVTYVSLQSTLSQGDVVYEVSIALPAGEAAELPIRWGMTAFVDIR